MNQLYFKITNKDHIELELARNDGINVKTNLWSNELVYGCSFTTHEHIHRFYDRGKYLRVVHLPNQSENNFVMIYVPVCHSYRANDIVFGERYSLTDPETYKKFSLPYPKNGALVSLNSLDFIKYLIQEEVIDPQQDFEELLVESVKQKNFEFAKYFIDLGTNISVIDKQIFISYIRSENLDHLKCLINIGADIDGIKDELLWFSIIKGKLGMAKYLVSIGAKITNESSYDLFTCCTYNSLGTIKYLLETMIDVHFNDDELLLRSVIDGNYMLVKRFVRGGANVNARDGEILRTSQYYGHTKITEYLKNSGAVQEKDTKRKTERIKNKKSKKYKNDIDPIIINDDD